MTINQFLEASLAAAGENLRKQRVKVCRAMVAFRGEEVDSRDVLELALPATIDEFSRFILDSYTPTDRYSKPIDEPDDGVEAVRSRRRLSLLTTLRAMLRDATLAGVFPAVDPLADDPELRRRQSMRLAVDPADALGSMLKTRRSDQRTMAGLYAVGLMLGGMPVETLLATIDVVTPTTATVPLPHLGIQMPLTPMTRAHMMDMAERLRSRSSAFSTEELLGCMHAKQLLMSDSMMTDWTRFAAAVGLPAADIAAVITLYLNPEREAADHGAQQAALARVAAAVGRLMPEPQGRRCEAYWGVVMTGRQCTAQELYDRMYSAAGSPDPDDRAIALAVKGRLYCPCRQSGRRSRGAAATRRPTVDPRRSVLRRTLFVNATTATLTAIGRRYPDVWVLRHADSKRYVRIPAEQLDFMRSVLDTFGPTEADDIDIIFDHGDAPSAPSLDAGRAVVLLHPDLAGQTATVVGPDPQRSTPSTTYYRVSFTTPAGLRFTLSLPSNLING